MPTAKARQSEAGYTLIALLASMTIALILMGAAARGWRYVMQNDREEELIFRGRQIADAIRRYQLKNGNALPVSLEALVKGRFLRKPYKDPMTKAGKWRLVRQGETIAPIPGGVPQLPGAARPSPTPSRPPGPGVPTGEMYGGIAAVASTSKEKSFRLFNGRSRYNEWIFSPGQTYFIGKSPPLAMPGGGFQPAAGPSPKQPVPPRPSPSPRL